MNQRNLLIVVMVALVAFILYSYFAICPRLSPTERLARADQVFTATVVKVEGDAMKRDIQMQVGEVWKGDVPQTLTLPTKDFEQGKSYLIFALVYKGQYYISKCGGRYELENAASAIQELGAPLKTYK